MSKTIVSMVLISSLIFPTQAIKASREAIFDAAGIDGNLSKVKKCLAKGVSINAKDRAYDSTPLIYAAYWGRRAIVKELIKRGANVNAKDGDGWTALMYASKWAKDDVVMDLLAAGANPNLVAHDGSTALMDAAYILWGSKKAAKALIKAGAKLNVQDKHGWTALHYASRYDKQETVADLIKAGANPNIAAYDGTTALMEAANRANLKVCKLLLSAGADADAENDNGETALDLAIKSLKHAKKDTYDRHDREDKKDRKNLEEICKLLRSHKAAQQTAKKQADKKRQANSTQTGKKQAPCLIKESNQRPATVKKPVTRWARWKAKFLSFFKRS